MLSRFLTIFVLPVILIFGLVVQAAGEDRVKKNVLFLNSYHNGYAWSDGLLEGARSVLDQSKYKIDLQIEYMDSKKYDYEFVSTHLFDLYKKKFKDDRFDVIIVSDNDAFDFLTLRGSDLFPGVPIVFCGINDLDLSTISGREITGVMENMDVRETLEIALQLHPQKKHMVVIGDPSTTGLAIRHQVEAAEPALRGRLDFEYWSQFSLPEILRKVRELPGDTLLFIIPFYKSMGGKFYSSGEVLQEIRKNCDLPVYSAWEFLLGYGIVGGRLTSGFVHGQKAAELALQILGGKPASTIPVIQRTKDPYLFDYNELVRLGIPKGALPLGSRLINEPNAFYELDKEVFWTIMVSFAILMVILVLLIVNIVQRRSVEQKIKDQLSFLEILMDTIPQLVCWKDKEHRYLGANRAFTDFFGIENHESIIHQTDYNLLLPSGREFARWASRLDDEVIKTNRPRLKARRTVKDANGENVWLEMNKVPLRDQKGNVVGTLTTTENITREMNLERQLLQSQKMEAIGTLAGGIAHDFNNILTSIINSTELALIDVDDETMAGRDLNRALRAAERGSSLVKQILTFSRPSQEGFRPIDIEAVIQDAVGLLKASVPRNIDVRVDVRVENAMILADPTQIHQVLMNLCTNSFQALRGRGGILSVTLDEVAVEPDEAEFLNAVPGDYFKVSVEDNGPGIPAEIMDKIFDPFFTTKGKADGTGLGLAVVHGIIKGHKGTVSVASIVGEFTRFDVFLPRIEENEVLPVHDGGMALEGSERILFVEDDEDQFETTPRVLRSLGFSVVAERFPANAVRLVRETPDAFDLVITDYDMPGTDGLELARQIGEINERLPVIMVSGRLSVADGDAPLDNIRMVIRKPYNKAMISNAIRQVLAEE